MPKKPVTRSDAFSDPMNDAQMLAERMEWELYERVDQAFINRQLPLKTALNHLPPNWFIATAAFYHVPEDLPKAEKVEHLVSSLTDDDFLGQAVQGLADDHRRALTRVLNAGGWVRYSAVSQLVGDETPDSYHWETTPPPSAIGHLRLMALLAVGQVESGGHRIKAVVIPKELRIPLERFLQAAP